MRRVAVATKGVLEIPHLLRPGQLRIQCQRDVLRDLESLFRVDVPALLGGQSFARVVRLRVADLR